MIEQGELTSLSSSSAVWTSITFCSGVELDEVWGTPTFCRLRGHRWPEEGGGKNIQFGGRRSRFSSVKIGCTRCLRHAMHNQGIHSQHRYGKHVGHRRWIAKMTFMLSASHGRILLFVCHDHATHIERQIPPVGRHSINTGV